MFTHKEKLAMPSKFTMKVLLLGVIDRDNLIEAHSCVA